MVNRLKAALEGAVGTLVLYPDRRQGQVRRARRHHLGG